MSINTNFTATAILGGLLFSLSLSATPSEEVRAALRLKARWGLAAIVTACIAHESLSRYFTAHQEDEQKEAPAEQETEGKDLLPSTIERAKYFCKGSGYTLLTVGSMLAIYFSIEFSLYKISALDPVGDLHRMFERRPELYGPKSGDIWEARLAKQIDYENQHMVQGAGVGSLALAIPYLAYYQYRLPHAAIENFYKAFRR